MVNIWVGDSSQQEEYHQAGNDMASIIRDSVLPRGNTNDHMARASAYQIDTYYWCGNWESRYLFRFQNFCGILEVVPFLKDKDTKQDMLAATSQTL
jgi:hypothetical protein